MQKACKACTVSRFPNATNQVPFLSTRCFQKLRSQLDELLLRGSEAIRFKVHLILPARNGLFNFWRTIWSRRPVFHLLLHCPCHLLSLHYLHAKLGRSCPCSLLLLSCFNDACAGLGISLQTMRSPNTSASSSYLIIIW